MLAVGGDGCESRFFVVGFWARVDRVGLDSADLESADLDSAVFLDCFAVDFLATDGLAVEFFPWDCFAPRFGFPLARFRPADFFVGEFL